MDWRKEGESRAWQVQMEGRCNVCVRAGRTTSVQVET